VCFLSFLARAKRAAGRRCADRAADAGGISCRVAIAIAR
jgi:hypothetical protein